RIEGVEATVNYATEKAHVLASGDVDLQTLIAEVERTGYSASVPDPEGKSDDSEFRSLRMRLIVSIVLAVPVIVLSMVPAFQFPYWQWVSLVLTTPIVTWAAWSFHW